MDDADFKDMPKKYANTYFQCRPLGSKEPWITIYAEDVHILWAEDDDQVNYYMVRNNDRWYKSTEYEFKFDFPPIGVVNYFNTVAIANKYPARQWKKAANSENFVVYIPTAPIMDLLYEDYISPNKMNREFAWIESAVNELFNNKFFSYEEALALLNKGERIACAITKEFFVTNSHYNDSVLLWRYNVVVAEIRPHSVSYVEAMFEQETIDFFKRNK